MKAKMVFGAFMLLCGVCHAHAKGIVTITIDDAPASVFENALPLLEVYNVTPTMYVAPGKIGSDPWFMNWNQVEITHNVYGWEIGSHALNHTSLVNLDPSELLWEVLGADLELRLHNVVAASFASPYGDFNEDVIDVVQSTHTSHRGTWSHDPGQVAGVHDLADIDPFSISAHVVRHSDTPRELTDKIMRAYEKGQWLVLCFHGIVTEEPIEYQYAKSDFEQVLKFIADQGIPTATISEAIQ